MMNWTNFQMILRKCVRVRSCHMSNQPVSIPQCLFSYSCTVYLECGGEKPSFPFPYNEVNVPMVTFVNLLYVFKGWSRLTELEGGR